ncbi:isochorismate synthase [Kitasatospora sp. NPDC088346]|uniref:isochorismate synthase n=1 Tax=Kitasatospora sp. NPDC088346 TaxID=3364073 RepID=UPI0038283431
MTTASTAHDTAAALPGAAALLAAYRPGPSSAFFAGPSRTLLAEGVRATVADPARAADALRAARADGLAHPVVVGAIPFSPGAPSRLFVPEQVDWAPPLREDPLLQLPGARTAPATWRQRPVPAPEVYRDAVAEAVRRLTGDPELTKVVLARTLELTTPGGADLPSMLHRLARRDPDGYTFAVPAGGDATLIGASPELLVSRRGTAVSANPLAGSAARSTDLAEDVRRAAALLESPKDLHEHAVVVEAVRAALAPLCADLTVPEQPTLVRTAAMWHLSTTVTGTLADPATSALDLALALHPTPAVCGTPTDRARHLIGELEPFDRGLYTGVVGWGDLAGDGEWVVTLRCAEADGDLLRLFAGAGIVAASDPAAELAETGAKFRTFLHAVGLEESK